MREREVRGEEGEEEGESSIALTTTTTDMPRFSRLASAIRRVPDSHLPFVVSFFTLFFVFMLLMVSIGYLFLTGRLDMLDAMDEATYKKMYGGGSQTARSFNSERGARSSSDANHHKEELYVQHGSTDDDDRIHVELADPVHKEDVNYMRHAVEEDDDMNHPHLTSSNNGMFFHPIVHTQSSYSTTLENRACKGATMSTSNGNGAWDHVSTSSLKQKQKEVFDRYALTGFRNKATTDARILMEFLLSISPKPQNGCCAIFDVGANVGKYVEELKTMPIAKDCEVHAFEPNPEVFKIMSGRVANLKSVHLHNAGVAERPGNLTFYYQPGKADTGGSFMPEHSYDKYADQAGKMKTENVNVITLDDIFDAFIPDTVYIPLVKIDVEGLEHRVKTGMSRALASGRVQAVYWERKGSLDLEPFETEVKFMADHGYNVYVMGCSGARKHSCALTLVRVDGPFFDPIFDPKRHRAPNQGKYMTMNLLGVKRGHKFNDVVVKKMLAQ